MDSHEHLSHWESFYLLVGTAGATLAGLTFVAVTAAERIVRDRNNISSLRNRIDPALLAFTLSLLGCVLLMPTLTPLALALVLAGWECWRGQVENGLTLAGIASLSLLLVSLRNTLDMLMSAMYYNARKEQPASTPSTSTDSPNTDS